MKNTLKTSEESYKHRNASVRDYERLDQGWANLFTGGPQLVLMPIENEQKHISNKIFLWCPMTLKMTIKTVE